MNHILGTSLAPIATRIISCVAFVSVVGCAGASEPTKEVSTTGLSQQDAPTMKENPSIQLAQAQMAGGGESAVKEGAEQTTEQFKVTGDAEARRLAEQHVALKQYGWGRPTSVSEHAGQYIVTFDTPERERVLIGNRAVIVDRKSAVVSVQKRR